MITVIKFLVFIGRAGCLPHSTHDFSNWSDVCNFLDDLEGREEEFYREKWITDWADAQPTAAESEVRVGKFKDTREIVSVKYVQ